MNGVLRLVAVATVAIAGIFAAEAAKRDDWAQFGRYAEANAALKCAPDVVFMGNSITDFWPGKSPDFWRGHPGFVGRGISGQTTCEMLVRFRSDVVNLHPRVVAIMAGINDIAQNNGSIALENVLGNIVSMVEVARANGIRVALCSVLPCSSFPWRKELAPAPQVRKLNAMIAEYVAHRADEGVIYVDYYSSMTNDEGGLDVDLSADGCHPTAKGYAIMESVIVPALSVWLR